MTIDRETLNKLKISCHLRDIDISSLTHLYLPLIGLKSFSGYLWLINEAKFLKNEEDLTSSLTRLAKHLDISESSIMKDVLNPLEGVGLIRTYLDYGEDCYVCEVIKPMTGKEFLDTTHLSTLVGKLIGKGDWERTTAFFLRKMAIPKDSKNISKTFDNFYRKKIKKLAKEEVDESSSNYDFNMLDSRLREKGIDIPLRKPIQKRIVALSSVYSFHPGEVAEVIENCLTKEEGELKISTLSSCFIDLYNEKINKEPSVFFNIKETVYLKSIKPIEFIDLCEGRQATLDEIEFIQKLSNKLSLSSEVINTLFHFSFVKNKKISINYLTKIVDTLKKQNLSEIEQIRNHLKKAYENSNNSKKPTNKLNLTTTELKIDKELEEIENYFIKNKE